MLTLDSYGISNGGGGTLTSSAYYVRGLRGNTQKFPNSGGVIEMAYLMGLNSAAPLGSNLLRARINTYDNVQSALRFNLVAGLNQLIVPSITGKRFNVSPIDPIWNVYR
jgi:hypothetical protein